MKRVVLYCVIGLLVLMSVGSMALGAQKATITVLTEDLVQGIPGGIRKAGEIFTGKTGIKVNFVLLEASGCREKAVLDMMAGGEPSYDVVKVIRSYMAELVDADYFLPLDQAFPEVLKETKQMIIPMESAWDACKYRGSLYAFPMDNNFPIWWYRTDQFAEVGLAGPPVTYQEVYEYAQKLTRDLNGDGRTDIYGYVGDWNDDNLWGNWCHKVTAFGGSIFNQDLTEVTFNSPAGLEALSWMKKFITEGLATPDTPSILSTGVKARVFNSGMAAMMNCYPFEWGWAQDPSKSEVIDKWAMALMPGSKVDKSVGWTAAGGGLAIPKGAKHAEAAAEFIKFITSDPDLHQIYAETGNLPFNKEVSQKYMTDPLFKLLAEQATYTLAQIFYSGHDVEIYQAFNRYFSYAINDQMTNEVALELAAEEANKILVR